MHIPPESPDPLDPLVEQWRKAPPPLTKSVSDEVWRRIAATAPRAAVKEGVFARMQGAFARLSFDLAFVAACVLLGLFLAEVRVSRLATDRSTELARSYMRLIDPLLETSKRGDSAVPRS